MAAPVELKPFRTCLGRPLKRPKGKFEFNYNIQIFGKKCNAGDLLKFPKRCIIRNKYGHFLSSPNNES